MKALDYLYLLSAPWVCAMQVQIALRCLGQGGIWGTGKALQGFGLAFLVLAATWMLLAIRRLQQGGTPRVFLRHVNLSASICLVLVYVWCAGLLFSPLAAMLRVSPISSPLIVTLIGRMVISLFLLAASHRIRGLVATQIHEKYFVA